MSLFPEPPPPGDMAFHMLEETAVAGPLGGPSYSYRGAVIDCQKGGYICRLRWSAWSEHRYGVAKWSLCRWVS